MKTPLRKRTVGQGKDIVLLHGWGVNSGVWQAISEPLQKHFRVTYIDLPGCGLNAQCLPENYDLASVADLVSQCLPTPCILLGWSLGGLVAQEIALARPEGIEQLVLVASSPKFSAAADWPGIDVKTLSFFQLQLAQDFSKTLDRFLAIQAMGSATAKTDIKQIKHSIGQLPSPSLPALKAGLAILADTDHRSKLASLKVRTHWMFGRRDSLVPAGLAERLPLLQPGARATIFDHASHAPFISHPQTFINQLFTLLTNT
ncbi:MAG: pimeloyl-[acyl-carrier protein] methyl ester esterase [Paraglaciecola sp.]|jgi:pimeloyl-[acyl-carrier protein] methyl ester esterase